MRTGSCAACVLTLCANVMAQQFLAEQAAILAPPPGFPPLPLAASGDFDGDGDDDLVLGSLFTVRLLRNDGAGNWVDVSAGLPPQASSATSVLFVDVDGDGREELLLGSYQGSKLFGYTAAGTWLDRSAGLPPGTVPLWFAAGDLDGDGDLDLVAAASFIGGGSNLLLRNLGNGTFVASQPFPGAAGLVTLFDCDGDGDLDVLLGDPTLWRNNGGMNFTNVTAGLGYGTTINYCAPGDVDGNGTVDLVVAYIASPTTTLLRNLGGGSFVADPTAAPAQAGDARGVQLFDADDDGDLDLLRSTVIGGVTLARNDGSGSFATAVPGLPATVGNTLLWAGDFDGDGDVDAFALSTVSVAYLLRNMHRQVAAPVPPVVGQVWQVHVWNAPGYAAAPRSAWLALASQRLPQAVALSPFGDLWLDLGGPFFVTTLVSQPAVTPTIVTFAIPGVPALQGVELHAQALVVGAAGLADARLTNLHTAVVQ